MIHYDRLTWTITCKYDRKLQQNKKFQNDKGIVETFYDAGVSNGYFVRY